MQCFPQQPQQQGVKRNILGKISSKEGHVALHTIGGREVKAQVLPLATTAVRGEGEYPE